MYKAAGVTEAVRWVVQVGGTGVNGSKQHYEAVVVIYLCWARVDQLAVHNTSSLIDSLSSTNVITITIISIYCSLTNVIWEIETLTLLTASLTHIITSPQGV